MIGEWTEQQLLVKKAVLSCADEAGVIARCRPSRRSSDLAMVFLRGPRAAVLGLPLRLFDALDERYDIEIVRSSSEDARYLLVLAVTEALDSQTPRDGERRAKLRRRLEGAEGDSAS